MEIFRTDGGGRYNNHTRLLKVVGSVMDSIPDNDPIWQQVQSIQDYKGTLIITLLDKVERLDILKSVFKIEWFNAGESMDQVQINIITERNSYV